MKEFCKSCKKELDKYKRALPPKSVNKKLKYKISKLIYFRFQDIKYQF